MSDDADLIQSLRQLGLVTPDEAPTLTPLAGGVSGDVFRVDAASGVFCLKRALPTLRVAGDWRAPVERSHYEVEWLKTVRTLPGVQVPHVIAEDEARHLFVMTYLEPTDHPVWKGQLAAGYIDMDVAAAVGQSLGRIHAATAYDPAIAQRFQSEALFDALRANPYLRTTAEAHPDLAGPLIALAERTLAARIALVHGDISPKNILVGPAGPVIVDAECAWFGDPAFDVAFVCTHLLLKALWRPTFSGRYRSAFAALTKAYLEMADWEPAAGLQARSAQILGALLLARVDGKSPVEYLTEPADKDFVRSTARPMVSAPLPSLDAVASRWMEALETR